ncbi:MAG: hypothetical protein SGPRY_002122 [Prymnesium sp.]
MPALDVPQSVPFPTVVDTTSKLIAFLVVRDGELIPLHMQVYHLRKALDLQLDEEEEEEEEEEVVPITAGPSRKKTKTMKQRTI